ncbi:MAG: acyltransferase [Cyclobacteriaceae bacterium]|jgi:peptidoglycan/LPS O-acetylase OafA/YrhL|nr:acyltransferase [Cyclobacteriaceae bacterium]
MVAKIETLDGLRGYAALLVLWAHFPVMGNLSKYSHLASSYTFAGYIGVDVFFALSGFLITRILIKEKESNDLSFKRFYLKRCLRIFPIYYLSIILVGLVISWNDLIWVATYLSNYYFSFQSAPNAMRHTWSLCVEEHFYIFWPLIIYLFTIEQARKVILVYIPLFVILGVLLTIIISDAALSDNLIYRASHLRILTLALGSGLAFFEKDILSLSQKKTWLLVSILTFAFIVCRFYHKIIYLKDINSSIIKLFTLSVFSTLLVSIVIKMNSNFLVKLKFIFTNSFIKFIGKISYGIYLYHYPIYFLFGYTIDDYQIESSIPQALIVVSLCLIVPTISFYLIEKPLLNLKEKIK